MVPRRMDLARARHLAERIRARRGGPFAHPPTMPREAPGRRIGHPDERAQKPRLLVFVAVRQKDMRHPEPGVRRQPRRLARRAARAVRPRRDRPRPPGNRARALEDGRGLADGSRRARERTRNEIHAAVGARRGRGRIADGLHAQEIGQGRRRGMEDDELAAARAERAERLHLRRRRTREPDEEGDALRRERVGHLARRHDAGRHLLLPQPAADVVRKRRVVPRIVRDDERGQ